MRVFLVMPDLSPAKVAALCKAGAPDVLVSYSTLLWKPVTLERLRGAWRSGCLGSVMLDSGAYHHARGELSVDVGSYAGMAWSLAREGLAGYVVAPDVPGDPGETLRRTLEFSWLYPGEFVPVAQPPRGAPDPRAHAGELQRLAGEGLLDRAPRVPGGRLVGLGGLDGARRRAGYVTGLLEAVEELGLGVRVHLFGAGARLLRSIARRGLTRLVHSVDTSGWLAEIMFRRRSVYAAHTTIEANVAAIEGYLGRLATALEGS